MTALKRKLTPRQMWLRRQKGMTLKTIAEEAGVGRERVRQLLFLYERRHR